MTVKYATIGGAIVGVIDEGDTVNLETAPVDLDPIVRDGVVYLPPGAVLHMTLPDAEVEIPDGWDLLPGGVERTIGVNQGWIRDFMGRPWRIEVDGTVIARADEFRILGDARSVAIETQEPVYDCGEPTGRIEPRTEPRRAARIATSAPILIRY